MVPEKLPRHALFLRVGSCEIGALGVPAIVAVILLALLAAVWFGIL
jgi:hypothetical protein